MFDKYTKEMTLAEKVFFLVQLPVLFIVSKLNNVPIYSIQLPFPISKNKTLLPFLWKNSEYLVPKWFTDFDFRPMQNQLFLDVGSHIGLFSAVFLKKGGKKAYLFDINPSINKLLQKECLSWHGQMNVCGYGLSDTDGEQEIFFDNRFSLMSTLDANRYANKNLKNFSKKGSVPVHSLDAVADLLFEKEKIGLIKLDVEGIEDRVLRGAKATLLKHKPNIIFEANRAGDFEKCEKILKPLGYRFRSLDSSNWLAYLTRAKKTGLKK